MARTKKEEKVMVASADAMLLLPFRLHIQNRHPNVRFRTWDFHQWDHDHNSEGLDHVHSNEAPAEPESDQVV